MAGARGQQQRIVAPLVVHEVSITVVAWGEQDTAVVTHRGARDGSGAYVAVRIGRTLTYCHDRLALDAFAEAWVEAADIGRRLALPDEPVLTERAVSTMDVCTSCVAAGAQLVRVTGLGVQASPNGQAHVVVKVGRSSVQVYSRAALAACVGAWAAALDHHTVFGGGGQAFRALARARARR